MPLGRAPLLSAIELVGDIFALDVTTVVAVVVIVIIPIVTLKYKSKRLICFILFLRHPLQVYTALLFLLLLPLLVLVSYPHKSTILGW